MVFMGRWRMDSRNNKGQSGSNYFFNRNFCQRLKFRAKSQFRSKIKILAKNWNFGRKLKFWPKCWSKIEISVENWNFDRKTEMLVENRNFGQKLKFWRKIEISFEKWNFGQKFKLWPKNRNVGGKSKVRSKIKTLRKIEILVKKKRNFSQLFEHLFFCKYLYLIPKIRASKMIRRQRKKLN